MNSLVLRGANLSVNRAALDFRLRPDARAVDAGVPIWHVAEGAAGKAPDAGALEVGHAYQDEAGKVPTVPDWLLRE